MQRLQQTLGAGLIMGLVLSVAAPAQAQVYYVQSPSSYTVPVVQSVAHTQTYVAPRVSNYSYRSSYSYGSRGSSFNGMAWNNRRSAPPIYSETTYLPESNFVHPSSAYQSVESSYPVVSYQSVATAPTVVYSDPVYVSRPVVSSVYVEASTPVASATSVVRERAVCLPQHVKSKATVTLHDSNGNRVRTLQSSTPKVSVSEANGRRVTTHRYEYDLDQPSGRVTIEFDSNN